jgi:hypothetical protein
VVLGVPATNINLVEDFGLPASHDFLEYSGKYQLRPRWQVFYSMMPIELEGNKTLTRNLWFRQWLLPAGSRVNTRWLFTYQRLSLVYQPIVSCNAVVSIFGGWSYSYNWYRVHNEGCNGQTAMVTRNTHMANSGIEVQKCIQTLCNGSTFSCHNRVTLSYLDNTLITDVQAGLQFSVPMGFNRFGFARGGYRYINFAEDRTDLRLEHNISGGFIEGGLMF